MPLDPLPIDEVLDPILTAARSGAFVVVAPPGAGKTTRVPPALLRQVSGAVWVLEPRRMAARTTARRIASERGSKLGDEIGYQVRYDKVGGPSTRLWAVTDGVLLRRLHDDPLLEGIGAVILDEVHERGLEVDLALALLAEVREARPDLVVGAMSATLDAEPIAAFLGGAPIVRSEGRTFPVTIEHLPLPDDRPIEDQAADAVRRLGSLDGDVLVFLPGRREIRRVAERLAAHGAEIVPLHGDLPPEEQDRALAAGRAPRVILATNVAETSVTVPGVTVVIDSGWARQPRLDWGTGLDHLELVRISRASADQRAGRAGRVRPGRAVRLWTEREHRARAAHEAPEVHRVDLCGPVLQICLWNADPRSFRWLDPPPPEAIDAALRTLAELGAVDGHAPTALGRQLGALPLHPRLGRLLLAAARAGHARDGARLAAWLSERDPLRGRRPTHWSRSDLVDRLDLWADRQLDPAFTSVVGRAADQLLRGCPPPSERLERGEALERAILAAWPDRVARRRAAGSERARMVGGKGLALDPCSAVTEDELFVAVELEADGADARVRLASAIDAAWLATTEADEVVFDEESESARGRRVVRYRDLPIASRTAPAPAEEAARVLVEAARGRIERLWSTEIEAVRLRARLAFLARRDPDGPWTIPWEEVLVAVAEGCRSFAEVRKLNQIALVRAHLGHRAWSELDRLAPERIAVASGSRVAVDYEEDPPALAVRIQELFGSTRTPAVLGGQVRLKLQLLAPNGRPQQITDDLDGFWDRTWPEVRKELRARYPRHAWPEDPRSAPAEARPKRRG